MGINNPSPSLPGYRRMMVFVDGENLTIRYQDMIKLGCKPRPDVLHEEDVYAWIPTTIRAMHHEILRAYYYTHATGDTERISNIQNRIKSMIFNSDFFSQLPITLYPVVFKKEKKERNSKGVDIQMVVDILNHVHSNNLDTVYLVTGDGDFLPVVNEIIRSGKQIYLAAFSSGLNELLKERVDYFIKLDGIYFTS